MNGAKQATIAVIALLAAGSCTLCTAQVTYGVTKDDAVMAKPRPPSHDLVDMLTGKTKELKAQNRAWAERVNSIKQVLDQFPQISRNDGFYPGWQGDYANCVDTQTGTTNPSMRDSDLGRGDHGLSPDRAILLPSSSVVGKCLTDINSKYQQKESAQANEQNRRSELATCEASPQGQLAQVSAGIVFTRVVVDSAKAAIDQDKKVAAVSGVMDLDARHKNGELIVNGERAISGYFQQYRQLGGQATNADAVVATSDPCKSLRK